MDLLYYPSNTQSHLLSETPLGREFQRAFEPMYAANDTGHRAEHFAAVESLAIEMNQEMALGQSNRLITAVAWVHDLFAWSRKNHHELSYHWVMSTDHELITQFDREGRVMIAEACESHRASFKGVLPSTLAELMSAADRGRPDTLHEELIRGQMYSIAYLGMAEEEGLMRSVTHQQEKYGRHGYARYPNLYYLYFKDALEARYSAIDALQTMTYDEVLTFINHSSA